MSHNYKTLIDGRDISRHYPGLRRRQRLHLHSPAPTSTTRYHHISGSQLSRDITTRQHVQSICINYADVIFPRIVDYYPVWWNSVVFFPRFKLNAWPKTLLLSPALDDLLIGARNCSFSLRCLIETAGFRTNCSKHLNCINTWVH